MALTPFVIDLTREITREELIREVDHAIASAACLQVEEGEHYLLKAVLDPLTFLHNYFYYQIEDEIKAKNDAECLQRYIACYGEEEGRKKYHENFPEI